MGIEQEIEAIRTGIQADCFPNEASVSQGIVLRLLAALSWPAYDTRVVWPEYSLSGRRVDYALCHPPGRPIAFIEVKQIGQSDGAERQLFEYAFHDGVPMAILTDGREWNFFLPGEQGDYRERRVYKLDIVERDVSECAARLQRYLLHSSVASGGAIQAARDDYRNVSRDRQMKAALPTAWNKLVEDEDDMLVEIVADRVESVCGFKPDPDMVLGFLNGMTTGRAIQTQLSQSQTAIPVTSRPTQPIVAIQSSQIPIVPTRELSLNRDRDQPGISSHPNRIGYEIDGQFHPARNAIDVLRQILENLSAKDASFSERFAAEPHGKSRRYLSRKRDDLYRRPDLCIRHSFQLSSGWWMSTNHSRSTIETIIQLACTIAGLKYGQSLVANLGN